MKRQHRLWWQSSYDRGLDILLGMWPAIREKYPDAQLYITYGWNLFEVAYRDNPERMAWKGRVDKLMVQPGITHFGRVGKDRLANLRTQCGIWAYCTFFPEICCISALECQRDGVVPVTMDFAALSETVQSGVKVKGDIFDKETQDEFLKQLLSLMGDEKRWVNEVDRGKEFAKDYEWARVASEWVKYL